MTTQVDDQFAIPLSDNDNDNDNWPHCCSLAVNPEEIKCERGVTLLECLDVSFNICFEYSDTLKFLSIQTSGYDIFHIYLI